MKREHVFLGLIVLFFLSTRLFKITQIPPSVYWDEASIGYNAYSVGIDGKDEWGSFLPIHFRAFGEFKLPVYIYSVVPFVKIFGLNAFSVRLPSVIYSLVSLILIYLVAKKLYNLEIGLASAFVFTVVPWDFIFGRTGYEASAGMAFFLLGVYLFLKTEKKPFFFLLSTLSFIASFYSYNSFRFISPMFLIIFGMIFLLRRDLKIRNKIVYVGISLFIFLAAAFPVYRLYRFDAGSSRINQVQAGNAVQIVKNYFLHFSPNFLFINGDTNLRSNNPGFGELYFVSLPFILVGIYALVKNRNRYWWIPILGILLGPIPAAITKESPHALRSISMLPFFAMTIGVGIEYLINIFKKKKLAIAGITAAMFIFSFESYFTDFITKYPEASSSDWQFGYKKIFEDYSPYFDKYQNIIISDEYAQPYIFALYYQKYNPEEFRKTVTYNAVDNWGFSTIKSFGKFSFKKIQPDDLGAGNLVFSASSDKIKGVLPAGDIKNPDGSVSFWVYSK